MIVAGSTAKNFGREFYSCGRRVLDIVLYIAGKKQITDLAGATARHRPSDSQCLNLAVEALTLNHIAQLHHIDMKP